MSEQDVTLQAIATQVARDFIHRLAPAFRPPARLVCPSDEAEQAIVEAVTQAAAALILCGFDVFGDDTHDGPTYPFRSEFQFDEKFLWLFVGRDKSRPKTGGLSTVLKHKVFRRASQ